MASTPQVPPTPPQMPPATPVPPAQKKTSPLVWVLVGCGGIVLLAAVIMLVAGVFVAKKVGSYAKEAEKNPAMAAAKMIVAMNPDLETVSTDESAGTITIRNKKTGEVITVDLDDIKKGKLRFKNEKGETAEISASGEGESGKIEIKSDKGSMSFGSGAETQAPAWVPAYPGVQPQGMYSTKGPGGTSAAYAFDTKDSPATVMRYYEEKLKEAGFEVTSSTFKKGAELAGGLVNAEAKAEKREIHVSVSAQGEGTKVAVNFTEGEGM
jgi:hypothetical protein